MLWEEWKPFYLDIVEKLELDVQADRMATALLADLLEDIDPEPLLRDLKELVAGCTVIVCGAGPSLERHLETVIDSKEFSNAVYVAADGAISAFVNLGLNCDIIVTDLDGRMEHIREAVEHGTLAIVHAHGDNIEVVREYFLLKSMMSLPDNRLSSSVMDSVYPQFVRAKMLFKHGPKFSQCLS